MERQQIERHLFRLVSVVRNAACHCSLSKYTGSFQQNYWILIFNNFLDMAVLEWCKVFGSHGEPTHWKNLVDDHTSFRTGLLRRLELDEDKWEAYWKDMKEYRDYQIAHYKKPPNLTNYPSLDIALEASYYYYEWIIQKLRSLGHSGYPDNLQDYYESFLTQALKFSENAYDSTKSLGEEVY